MSAFYPTAPARYARLATPHGARAAFWLAFWLLLAFRGWLAWAFPLIGDEAYYARWGLEPALGYYDHPPLTGLLMALIVPFGLNEIWLRLPQIVVVHATALAIVAAVHDLGEGRRTAEGWLAALLFLLSGPSVVNVILSTDTPLLLLTFLSGWCWLRGVRSGRAHDFAFAGLLLGLAFWSKYFVLLLGLTYCVHALATPAVRRGFAILLGAALPFGLAHLAWNYSTCWWTVLFHFQNRPPHDDGVALSLGLLALTMLYLVPPPLLAAWWRGRRDPRAWVAQPVSRALALMIAVPALVFVAVAFGRPVGFHWVLALWSFVFLSLGTTAAATRIARTVPFMVVFAAVHVLVAGAIAALPAETIRDLPGVRLSEHGYAGLVLIKHRHEVGARLPSDGAVLGAVSGSTAATLWHASGGRRTTVFGEGSGYSRQFDRDFDFRTLDGGAALLLNKRPFAEADREALARWFAAVEYATIEVRGARFHLARGMQFRYPTYRDEVLVRVRDRYYAHPAWLPAGGCFFCERYFDGAACPVHP